MRVANGSRGAEKSNISRNHSAARPTSSTPLLATSYSSPPSQTLDPKDPFENNQTLKKAQGILQTRDRILHPRQGVFSYCSRVGRWTTLASTSRVPNKRSPYYRQGDAHNNDGFIKASNAQIIYWIALSGGIMGMSMALQFGAPAVMNEALNRLERSLAAFCDNQNTANPYACTPPTLDQISQGAVSTLSIINQTLPAAMVMTQRNLGLAVANVDFEFIGLYYALINLVVKSGLVGLGLGVVGALGGLVCRSSQTNFADRVLTLRRFANASWDHWLRRQLQLTGYVLRFAFKYVSPALIVLFLKEMVEGWNYTAHLAQLQDEHGQLCQIEKSNSIFGAFIDYGVICQLSLNMLFKEEALCQPPAGGFVQGAIFSNYLGVAGAFQPAWLTMVYRIVVAARLGLHLSWGVIGGYALHSSGLLARCLPRVDNQLCARNKGILTRLMYWWDTLETRYPVYEYYRSRGEKITMILWLLVLGLALPTFFVVIGGKLAKHFELPSVWALLLQYVWKREPDKKVSMQFDAVITADGGVAVGEEIWAALILAGAVWLATIIVPLVSAVIQRCCSHKRPVDLGQLSRSRLDLVHHVAELERAVETKLGFPPEPSLPHQIHSAASLTTTLVGVAAVVMSIDVFAGVIGQAGAPGVYCGTWQDKIEAVSLADIVGANATCTYTDDILEPKLLSVGWAWPTSMLLVTAAPFAVIMGAMALLLLRGLAWELPRRTCCRPCVALPPDTVEIARARLLRHRARLEEIQALLEGQAEPENNGRAFSAAPAYGRGQGEQQGTIVVQMSPAEGKPAGGAGRDTASVEAQTSGGEFSEGRRGPRLIGAYGTGRGVVPSVLQSDRLPRRTNRLGV